MPTMLSDRWLPSTRPIRIHALGRIVFLPLNPLKEDCEQRSVSQILQFPEILTTCRVQYHSHLNRVFEVASPATFWSQQ